MKLTLPACFPLELDLRWVGPRQGVFASPFVYLSSTHGRFEIEKGFDTDFASIPRGLWNLFPPDGPYAPAAFIHDWLYWYQVVPREVADAVFLEGMQALGIGWFTRSTIYRAVRLGGGGPWEENRRRRLGIDEPITPARQQRHFAKIRRK